MNLLQRTGKDAEKFTADTDFRAPFFTNCKKN